MNYYDTPRDAYSSGEIASEAVVQFLGQSIRRLEDISEMCTGAAVKCRLKNPATVDLPNFKLGVNFV